MFSSIKKSDRAAQRRAASSRDAHAVTILTSGCHFSGKLHCRGASRIGGKIEGQIISEGLLIIEEEAQVHAEIVAEEAVIKGQVTGKIQASRRLELAATSQVHGDLQTPVLLIREGAAFTGHATTLKRDEAGASKPTVSQLAAALPVTGHGRPNKAPGSKAANSDKVPAIDGPAAVAGDLPDIHVPTR